MTRGLFSHSVKSNIRTGTGAEIARMTVSGGTMVDALAGQRDWPTALSV